MPSKIAFAAAAMTAASILISTPASGASLVLGQGLATTCSKAALSDRKDLKSIDTCTQALETQAMGPRDRAGTFVNRGILKLRRKSYDDARIDFAEALKLDPDLGEAYVNWGASLIAENRYAEGLSEIDRGMALGVDEPEKAWFNRAIAYEGMNDPKNAYLAYQKAVELAPEWQAPQVQLTRFSVTRR
ncbi:tetratricopeptide repeat protein [Caulobacter sp. SLTY]|uniref:tetratricopeptide repeat protein n=1 Tax=Caulobacter sp. SLTY TaxID=2683262 RepID=UPI0014121719|nr:tetratricopeptide repeat protein [Caulobacter sp. SLTY]NBB15418.1 tetratricopeptide repeat protein [Caulobacter sp. SLTY]